ncbi:MAG: 2-dehydropantoate 2-reductase [Candidatus Tectomicrobia bacterium]|nr:2-dehydropantoate 2-reductase [Candidatus Tectomicrobia bacterium]
MKVAVMGAGAVGSYYGGLLARAGEEVHLVGRGEHVRAVRERGLRVESPSEGDFSLPPEAVRATEDPGEVGPADWVFFAVKGPDTERAASALPPLLRSGTFILTVQNGVDSAERIAGVLARGGARPDVLPGAVYIEATLVSPGVVRHAGGPRRLVFGERTGAPTPRAEAVREVFGRTGVPVELTERIEAALWSKFLYICPMSGMTAVTRRGLRAILDLPETRALYHSALREVEAVARARGVDLPPDAVQRVIAFSDGLPDMRSSLQKDLEADKPLEIESLAGAAVRLGKEAGVPTPIHDILYACLKLQDPGASANGRYQ